MSPARYLPKNDYLGLKATFRRLVVLVGGGNEAAAQTRVGQQALDRYGSISAEHEDRFAPADVIADLEAACGEPIVTRKLAELSGHVLVPLPVVQGSTARLDQVTGKALMEVGQVFTRLGEARADGVICDNEAAALKREIGEAVTMLLKLDRAIDAVSEVEP